jgi:repressor LexA
MVVVKKKELTEKQRAVLDFIKGHVVDRGFPPTIREICTQFGFSSPLSAKQHVDALERKGYIKKSPAKQRGIEVVGFRPTGAMSLPLVTRIRAGSPVYAAEEVEQYVTLDGALFKTEKGFAYRVVGHSMVKAGIFDGDIVFVDPAQVNNGDIALVVVGEDVSLKRFYAEGENVKLVPENNDMSETVVKSSDATITGKVIGVLRKIG